MVSFCPRIFLFALLNFNFLHSRRLCRSLKILKLFIPICHSRCVNKSAAPIPCGIKFHSPVGNAECFSCPVGHYCPYAVTVSPISCPSGYYNVLTEQAACTICPRGLWSSLFRILVGKEIAVDFPPELTVVSGFAVREKKTTGSQSHARAHCRVITCHSWLSIPAHSGSQWVPGRSLGTEMATLPEGIDAEIKERAQAKGLYLQLSIMTEIHLIPNLFNILEVRYTPSL